MIVLHATVRFYTRPVNQSRIASRKNARNYITVTEMRKINKNFIL
ncbi:hypothetical protein SAMN04487918_101959 [Bacillus sp. bc15]|nr:hypothetical protein ICE_01933 [Bacillus cereus BAG1X1-2]PFG82277.1 hypothetical protein DL97_1904 [Bacillus sp. YF23]SHK99439.1 hypothetical protein SAMN04487918_101959 [Bacillus sp. bc15]